MSRKITRYYFEGFYKNKDILDESLYTTFQGGFDAGVHWYQNSINISDIHVGECFETFEGGSYIKVSTYSSKSVYIDITFCEKGLGATRVRRITLKEWVERCES